MTVRSLPQILATTLITVTAPQLARATQPEAAGGAGASLDAGMETPPETTSTAEPESPPASADSGSNSSSDSAPAPAPVIVSSAYDGIKGKLRLHFDVDFRVQPGLSSLDDVGFAALFRPQYGLGFGYGVHKHIIIGAKLAFNFTRVRNRTDAVLDVDVLEVERSSIGSFTPYVEFLPIATGRILPFIGVRAGFGWQTDAARQKGDVMGTPVDVGTRTSQLGPLVGLSGGAHFFLTPSFSLDASALFDTRWNFGRTRQLGEGAAGPTDWSPSNSIMSLGLGLGLSGWF